MKNKLNDPIFFPHMSYYILPVLNLRYQLFLQRCIFYNIFSKAKRVFLTRVNCLSLLTKAFHFPRCCNTTFNTFKALLVRSVLIELALLSKTTSYRAISIRSPQNFLLLELLSSKGFAQVYFRQGNNCFLPQPSFFLWLSPQFSQEQNTENLVPRTFFAPRPNRKTASHVLSTFSAASRSCRSTASLYRFCPFSSLCVRITV